MSKRNVILDIVKGIGILFVVFAHVMSGTFTNRVIYMFHMPLFFIVSGMTMYYSSIDRVDFRTFISKKAKGILIPYFIFLILSFIYWVVIERQLRNQLDISIFSNLLNIFFAKVDMELYASNVVMWFLPCLFTSEIFFFFLMKLKRNRTLIAVTSLVLGYILSTFNLILPWGIETAFIGCALLYFGYMLQVKKNMFVKHNLLLFLLGVFGLFICLVFGHRLNMLGHYYGNILLFIIGAFSGTCLVFVGSRKVRNVNVLNRVLSFLGKNSIIIMCIHEPIKRIVLKLVIIVFRVEEVFIRSNPLWSFVITCVLVLIIFPFIYIINRYLPFMIGKFKKHKQKV